MQQRLKKSILELVTYGLPFTVFAEKMITNKYPPSNMDKNRNIYDQNAPNGAFGASCLWSFFIVFFPFFAQNWLQINTPHQIWTKIWLFLTKKYAKKYKKPYFCPFLMGGILS